MKQNSFNLHAGKDAYIEKVGIAFVVEVIILSEKMRDKRLTDLDQDQVENLAMELYLFIDMLRNKGEGYIEMCDASNCIIDKHLSRIDVSEDTKEAQDD